MKKVLCLFASVMTIVLFAWHGTGESLARLTSHEMSRKVADNCGATTNLVWSSCGFDAVDCEANKIAISSPNFTIPGTSITIPTAGKIGEWESGCGNSAGKTFCTKRQHEQAVSAPGNRVNDDFVECGGTTGKYEEFQCEDKLLVISSGGFDLPYLCYEDGHFMTCYFRVEITAPVTVPHGCQEKPGTRSIPFICPNKYQTMEDCTSG